MKLRQKLAVVLASAMVLTAVPVVTMAASTTSVSKVITTANTTDALGATAPVVKVELKDTLTSNQFYLALEGAEWDKNADGTWKTTDVTTVDGSVATIVPTSKTEATVQITNLASLAAGKTLQFQLSNAIVKGDEAYVVIDGNDTEITNDKVLFAAKSTAKAKVTSKNDQTFYTTSRSEISEIVVEEVVAGTFNAQHKIVIDLENSDFEFHTGSAVAVAGTKGMATPDAADVDVDITADTIEITLPAGANASRGGYKITGIEVKSVDKAPETGDLEVTVSGSKVSGGAKTIDTTTLAVAKVAEYGATLTVTEKKEVVSGKESKVKVSLKQNTADSVAKGDVEFTVENAVIKAGTLPSTVTPVLKDKKDESKGYTGFIVTFGGTGSEKEIKDLELTLQTEVTTKGDITVQAEGRYLGETAALVVATANQSFAVDTEAMTLKVGQTKQVGGKVVITEAEGATFKRGATFEISIPTEDGITLTELPEVSATNGMTVKASWKDAKTTTGAAVVVVEVTKASRDAAAEITIENFEAKTDRTVAQGSYDLTLKVSDLNGKVEVADFLVIGTPNTEDLASNGLARGTSTFVIGAKEYTFNGVTYAMDAASYAQAPGYTMVPVRYVAEAFGVKGTDILFSNGTATIFAGNRTIQLTNNSDIAIVNGAQIKMATKVVMKDGRTYAPIGEVAQMLGISKSWDAETKTASFTNK